jgi:hypothetical protein
MHKFFNLSQVDMKYDIVYNQWTRSIDINEDTFLVTENIVWVFDGASSLVPYLSESGKTWWYQASQIIKEFFSW